MKATQRKIFIERARKERRARKLLRRQKRYKMAPKNNSLPEPGELPKYAALADRLESDLTKLGDLHKQREEFTGQSKALALTRDRLHQSFLDAEAPAQTLAESLGELETERLVLAGSLEALGPRIQQKETELHEILPHAIDCFGRLRVYTHGCALEAARSQIRALVDPSITVEDQHVDALAISLPAFVAASRINLPGLSWAWSRPLDAAPPHWSSMVRAYTAQELASLRSEAVKSMVEAANELLRAARALIAAATPYAQDVPAFKCEAEVIAPPQSVAPLEWLQPLGSGSDEEWLKEICQQAGKPYPPTDPAQIEILNRMLEARHAHPVSHGIITGEMLGSTFVER